MAVLYMPEFFFETPKTLVEAVELMGRPGTRIIAGGTDLLPNLKRRQVSAETLISLTGIDELRGISGDAAAGLSIGAVTTLAEVAGHPAVVASYPGLAKAAGAVASPPLRNAATLGGNLCLDTRCQYLNQTEFWRGSLGYCLKAGGEICRVAPKSPRCWAVTSTDTAPALMAIGASVRLVGPKGERTIPMENLYGPDGIFYLAKLPGEILAQVLVPSALPRHDAGAAPGAAGTLRSTYLKLRRRGSIDFPSAGVGAAVRVDEAGTVTGARVVLGAVGSRPLVIEEASGLVGKPFRSDADETLAAIGEIAKAAVQAAKPVDNVDLPVAYRKRMAGVFAARALREMM